MITTRPKVRERQNQILEKLALEGSVRVAQLSQELDATVVTIRHDLDALEQQGLLLRVQGGAVLPDPTAQTPDFFHRMQLNREKKLLIAAAAADLVHDDDTLFINSGSTTHYFAQQLKHLKNISVVTNSLHVAEELGRVPTFRVILLGGNINAQFAFTSGDDTISQLSRYRADHAFLSVDGICMDGRITTYHSNEAAVSRLMMERSGSTIVTADYSKIGKEGFTYISDVQQMNTLITDAQADPRVIENLRAAGVQVLVATPPDG